MKCLMLIACLSTLTITRAENEAKEAIQVIQHPNKNEYASHIPGSDKHKYGYELNENKYFHHTTTEDDGVRLGCYGFVLEGKKYSTQYVADSRGYRPVFTHDPITVYPKSGAERKASFVGEFNEAEQQSKNIRYFFPDGCKGVEFNKPNGQPSTKVIVKNEKPVTIPKKPSNEFQPPSVPSTPAKPARPIVPIVNPPNRIEQPIVKTTLPPRVIVDRIPAEQSKTVISTTTAKITQQPSCPSKSSCCDDDKPKLVLPVPLKGKSGGDSCSFGKLVIPVEGLDVEKLKSLANGGDTKDLIRAILQTLQ